MGELVAELASRAGRRVRSCARWPARPRATRSSSRRSCATSATRAGALSRGGDARARRACPDGVREVTARRLRRLTEPTRAVLLVASVIGREFDYDVLAAVVSAGDDELVEALEEGVEARVLREAGHVGRYAFTHALVRATLYDSISQLRRARLHGRVGEALVRAARRRPRPAPGDARAPLRAGGAGRAARPRDRLRARRRAPRRPAARLGGGRAALPRGAAGARAGRRGRRPRARRAAARARRVRGPRGAGGGGARDVPGGDPHRAPARRRGAAGAAPRSASPGRGRRSARVDPERVALLDEALEALAGGGLAAARAAAGADRRWSSTTRASRSCGCRCREEAVDDRAPDRRPADAGDLPRRAPLRALAARERRGAARGRRRAAARGRGDRRPRARAAGRGLDDHRPDGARRHRGRRHPDRRRLEARRGAAPPDLAVVDVAVPRRARAAGGRLRRGRAARRRRRWRSASAARPRTPCTTTRRRCSTSAASRAGWPRSRARCAASSSSTRRSRPGAARSRCCWSSSGARTRRARSSRRSPRAASPAFPRDANWLIAITLMAEVCGALGDARARGGALRGCSSPTRAATWSSGRNATCNGSASRLLGILAAALRRVRRWPSATSTRRRRCTRAMGARPWHARTQVAYAEMLLARRQRGDDARARELLADALGRRRAGHGRAGRARARALVAGGPPRRVARERGRRWRHRRRRGPSRP